MVITNLEYMEQVVSARTDLGWEGWNVVKYVKSDSAFYSVDGVLKNGQWYRKKVFPVTRSGWDVPVSVGRQNV